MLGLRLASRRAPSALLRAGAPSRAMSGPKIIYTLTDEAPMLATYSLLPIIKRFTDPAGINVETSDISVAARILFQFGLHDDTLGTLGDLAKTPEANIIKLPNVSASIPQLVEAIQELQSQGYDVPNFPASPSNAEEEAIKAKYSNVLGSAVNPVLREGNSDRRVAGPVKTYAQGNPHKMGAWSADSRTHVASMSDGDFFSSEQSATMAADDDVKITHVGAGGVSTVLKESTPLIAGEVIDASRMSASALREFFETEISDANENPSVDNNLMLSLHMKATMMKISDPIIFGHCVDVYFKDAFAKHAAAFEAAGVDLKNGLGDVYDKISDPAIIADVEACYTTRPPLAFVDSRKGITNLHVPSDVIIDASMPVVIRDSGMMWNKDDALEDVKCLIPDRCYAGTYQKVVEFCKANGQFDVATMGNVANVGLMAQKAEEYGSHDKTFEVASAGSIVVTNSAGDTVFEHSVEQGDIWRMAQTKDAPIKDWVGLAVNRAKATGVKTIFWLNSERAHDASIIAKVEKYMPEHDTSGLDIEIMAPEQAIVESMERAKAGKDTISVTGNVLRDYLTDLFPILELGTSAKMLSIVPMLAGGAMFETGAGGSAPKHVQQFVEEGHLRWDSLGEYLATAVSLEDLGTKTNNERAILLGQTLTAATGKVLDNRQSPSRKVNELDNRGTNFYIALYWAEEMAKHDSEFQGLADELAANKDAIISELVECQGEKLDIGGYYYPDPKKLTNLMCPSKILNGIIPPL